jgi:hypothetical protein
VERRARQAQVLLELFEGPWEAVHALRALAGGGAELPEGWRESAASKLTAVLHLELRGLAGSLMAARGFVGRPFVRDVESISGGTGFSIIATPDPVIGRAGDGFQASALVRETARPDGLELRLHVSRARTAFGESAQVLVPSSNVVPGGGEAERPTAPFQPPFLWTPYAIDLPRQTHFRARETAVVRKGRAAVLRIHEAAAGRGTVLVATARVVASFGEGR